MSWEENVRRVVPYTPGEQPNRPNMIKLNTNECPYPPSPRVEAALKELRASDLRLYPDPLCKSLNRTIADYYGRKEEEVFTGVGSDDVIAMIYLTFFNSRKPILFPDVTYSFYDVWAEEFGVPYETQPLDDDFNIVKSDYIGKPNGGIIFPNPNAPTGVLVATGFIEDIVKANPDSVVVVDEAYIDFGGKTALPLIDHYDNLLVVRTFSKSRALAGMRVGYCFGNEKLIKYLNDVKFSFNSYTLNRAALTLAEAAMKDDAYFKEITGKVIATRERVKKEMRTLGFTFRDSMANFIFATHPAVDMTKLYEELRKRDIYVRHFDGERIKNHLRITIGTEEEMDLFLQNVKEILL